MIEFEFDPEKSKANQLKHGLDFISAQQLWDDPWRVVIPTRCSDEKRWLMIANLEGLFWTTIYTMRDHRVRIISVRKSRDDEKEVYNG